MKGRTQLARFVLGLLAVLGLFAPSAEASVSVPRDVSSIKTDPFASLPQLTSKPIAERLAAVEQNDARCLALCELAASIDADPLGFGTKRRPFGGVATPFGRQYFYANDNPTLYTDPSGNVAVIDNVLGGALSTVIGFGVTCATKGCAAYMPEDAAVDFGLGFASSGLSGLKALKYAKDASRLANAAKISGRVAAQYGVGLAGEVTRHELKGEEYTVEEVSQQAVVGALVGEAGDLAAKGVRAGARQVASLLSKSESRTAKFLTREVSSFLPRGVDDGIRGSDRTFAQTSGAGADVYGPHYEQAKTFAAKDPAFFPDPDAAGTRVVQGNELATARRDYELAVARGELPRGHHRQGLLLGGTNTEPNITFTGEQTITRPELAGLDLSFYAEYGKPNARVLKLYQDQPGGIIRFGPNPRHTAATTFQNLVRRWQIAVGLRE